MITTNKNLAKLNPNHVQDGCFENEDSDEHGSGTEETVVLTFAGWEAPGYLDGLATGSQYEWDKGGIPVFSAMRRGLLCFLPIKTE